MRFAVMVMIAACNGSGSATQTTPPREPAFDDPYEFLPGDSTGFMALDMTKARRSSAWKKYGAEALQAFAPRFAKCGYDVISSMTSVVMTLPANDNDDSVIVARGVDRDKSMKC